MILGVVGNRDCDWELLELEYIIQKLPYDVREIASGGAIGIDQLADNYARKHGLIMTTFYPRLEGYKILGKKVFFERNEKIAMHCNVLLAIYTPFQKSGTSNTVRYAKGFKIPIYAVHPEDSEMRLWRWDYNAKDWILQEDVE